MKVKPILFNTEMVRAILEGRKSCTRRAIKPANKFKNYEYRQGDGLWIDGYSKDEEPNGHIKDYSVSSCWIDKDRYIDKYAPYHPGDIIYVRETWKIEEYYGDEALIVFKANGHKELYFEKNGEIDKKLDKFADKKGWQPSLFMPKEAARIWLKVADVRVERLQDIKEDGAINEGIIKSPCNECKAPFGCDNCISDDGTDEVDWFAELWNTTVKKTEINIYGWDANPYVWVIEFERCENPEVEE